jgi:hypothetical protein
LAMNTAFGILCCGNFPLPHKIAMVITYATFMCATINIQAITGFKPFAFDQTNTIHRRLLGSYRILAIPYKILVGYGYYKFLRMTVLLATPLVLFHAQVWKLLTYTLNRLM